jgi:DNA helicase-2/ATP-dependent DNA helicase PcrA
VPERPSLEELNPGQRAAALRGIEPADGFKPLLIIAGAGSGKTKTLAHRVAQLVAHGVQPDRLLLLTFTRRAASEMTRRAQSILGRLPRDRTISWAGTFHSIANRLLRLHCHELRLDPSFTVLDRADSADLMDVVRHGLGQSALKRRFPRKGTCLAIYSRTLNAQRPLEDCLAEAFPWCSEWALELRQLFRGYSEAKQERHVLDYDDLLLYWHYLMSEPDSAARVSSRFEHVLVDEYQDTNTLQAKILLALKPDGRGLTVVGDDAQAIYSFRGATVRNILDFPCQFENAATVVTLDQNYRSTQPILDAANQVIGISAERFTKDLFSTRTQGCPPLLISVEDELIQVEYIVARILEHRESGVLLKQQAVLFRAAHHSDALELELARRGIPFVKYGGLRFLEAAHIKDVLCILRWAENPRDSLAAFRALQLCPGIGPSLAERAFQHFGARQFVPAALREFLPPGTARAAWPSFCELICALRSAGSAWPGQLAGVRQWYEPQLERLYDGASARIADLDQLEQIGSQFSTRERFLAELMLDPPELSGAEAGPPLLDEDHLVLSTIHSAKGQEWTVVYILNVVDGCIPSDMAAGCPEQIEEERRLLYVAMTRARDFLHLLQPAKMFVAQQPRFGDRHVFVPRSRFIPDSVLACFERHAYARPQLPEDDPVDAGRAIDVAERIRAMWDG